MLPCNDLGQKLQVPRTYPRFGGIQQLEHKHHPSWLEFFPSPSLVCPFDTAGARLVSICLLCFFYIRRLAALPLGQAQAANRRASLSSLMMSTATRHWRRGLPRAARSCARCTVIHMACQGRVRVQGFGVWGLGPGA